MYYEGKYININGWLLMNYVVGVAFIYLFVLIVRALNITDGQAHPIR